MCRWTSSVFALIGIMSGIILTSSGVCILIFFVDEEPTIFPLGITLSVVGILLSLLGGIMWMSEFMCNQCLDKLHSKIQNAPIKNAIKRRSRMASRYFIFYIVFLLLLYIIITIINLSNNI